jgi:glycosyltransferase involved in cell wall biosynthesis
VIKGKKISLVLPCRNEAKHLEDVIKRVPSLVDEIIVVSNASTDDTLKKAKSLGVKALEDNRTIAGIGYGYAHITGIKQATGDIIIGADGDGTYPIENIAEVVDYLMTKKLDFVSCNRYPLQKGTTIPAKLRFGVWLLNMEVLTLYGRHMNDILSGMWAFKKEVRPRLQLTMGDWNLSPQIKLNALLHPKIAFGEYSIAQHQRLGRTHQKYLKTGLSHMFWIMKNRLTRQNVTKRRATE